MKKTDIEELREYRNLKASGRLLIIPEGMKDGDTVWTFSVKDGRVSSHMIIEWVVVTGRLFGKIALDDDYSLFSPDDIGKTVFPTKEAAEEMLAFRTKQVEDFADTMPEHQEKEYEVCWS